MGIAVRATDYASWREQARKLLQNDIPPSQVQWLAKHENTLLFDNELPGVSSKAYTITREFLEFAQAICYHRDDERFSLLYQMLWRLTHGEKYLMAITSDLLVHKLGIMRNAVKRDVHKTKAFVRFRKTVDDDQQEHYIAWHRPDHFTLPLSAPFFKRRFEVMRWTILTPDQSAHWDGETLHYGPGATLSDAPQNDEMEVLWREFYRAIFNPARVKIKMMKKEMPVRHWATLPEASIIHEILSEAPARIRKMIAHSEGEAQSAIEFLPELRDIEHLSIAASACQGCPLYRHATQTVFGVGPANARLMLVGEQPGDEEDKTGKPFTGPAGEILLRALKDAGIERSSIYITNAVKHFKFEYQNNRRLHRTPNLRDVTACKPWLEAEIQAIKPSVIVCLGVTAARSIITPRFKLEQQRGKPVTMNERIILPTYHAAAILRDAEEGSQKYALLVNDLQVAYKLIV